MHTHISITIFPDSAVSRFYPW